MIYSLDGNLTCAVDLETTGLRAGYHEIIQIAVVPLDHNFKVRTDVLPFYTTVRPDHPSREDAGASGVHGLSLNELILHAPSSDKVQELFIEWFNALQLPQNKSIAPLAHNWAFESSFLKPWLGEELFSQVFHAHARDSMVVGKYLNDHSLDRGHQILFERLSLTKMSSYLGIVNERPHDAYHDAITEAAVYQALIRHYPLLL